MSIYDRKHWHVLSYSLHFVRHEGRLATHPYSPARRSGPDDLFMYSVQPCLGPVPGQIDSPYLINNTQGWILYSFTVIYFLTLSYLSPPGHSRTVSLFSLSVTASNCRRNAYIILTVSTNEVKARSHLNLTTSKTGCQNSISCLALLLEFVSRVFQLILVELSLVYVIISQGPPLGFFYWRANLYATVDFLTRIINWLTARKTIRL